MGWPARLALIAMLGLAAAGLWWSAHDPVPTPAPGTTALPRATPPAFLTAPSDTSSSPRPAPEPDDVGTQVDRLAMLLASHDGLDEIELLERTLLALGAAASRALIDRLDRLDRVGDGRLVDSPSTRERLFHLLRRLPGAEAEGRLAEEARRGKQASLRTMAIESLGERKSAAAIEALAAVARQDGQLLARPLLGRPRTADDPSTEVPDEQLFTPRMEAMAALAATQSTRAAEVLADIASGGPDESLRMEAARNLGQLLPLPRARAALQRAAESDAAANVRLAALHALRTQPDPSLAPALVNIAAQDRDPGVRRLAQQVLAALNR